jgi:adenylate kinase family enzyme
MDYRTLFLRNSYQAIVGELNRQGKKLLVGAVGKPASGKGDQADILNNAGVPTQRSSAILDELGVEHELNILRASGKLIPADTMADLVIKKLNQRGYPDLIYLDGSPRAVSELENLVPVLKPVGYTMLILHFNISDELALQRRLQQNNGPGAKRLDAGREKERLVEYAEKTLPVIARAEELGVLVRTLPINEKTVQMPLAFQVMGKVSRAVFCSLPETLS